jgi:hypothetical protein
VNNDQQPKITPDYSYIMSQQTPLPKKVGPDKRIIIIGICVLLLIVMLLISLLPNKSRKKQLIANGAVEQVTAFTDALKSQDYVKAASIIRWQMSSDDQNAFAEKLRESASTIDYNTCTIKSVETKIGAQAVVQTCTSTDKRDEWTFTYSIINSNGLDRIANTAYKVSRNG